MLLLSWTLCTPWRLWPAARGIADLRCVRSKPLLHYTVHVFVLHHLPHVNVNTNHTLKAADWDLISLHALSRSKFLGGPTQVSVATYGWSTPPSLVTCATSHLACKSQRAGRVIPGDKRCWLQQPALMLAGCMQFVDEDQPQQLNITDGKHPMLDLSLEGAAVPNSLELRWDATRAAIITG